MKKVHKIYLSEIEKELKKRKWGVGSRLEVRDGEMHDDVLGLLT